MRAPEEGPGLLNPLVPCAPRDSPNSAPTPTVLGAQGTGLGLECRGSPGSGGRCQGLLTLMLNGIEVGVAWAPACGLLLHSLQPQAVPVTLVFNP